jgi:hypothetical protein
VPTHAGAFVQSFVKKSSKLCVFIYLFLKKNHRARFFFFSSRKLAKGLGRPRSLYCGRIRTPLRFRVGARPRRCLWEVVPPGRSAALVVVVNFFMRGCVFARDVRFARTRLGAREPRVAARGAHATR